MTVKQCDRCGKVHKESESRVIRFCCIDYDLCLDCKKSLQIWLQKKD